MSADDEEIAVDFASLRTLSGELEESQIMILTLPGAKVVLQYKSGLEPPFVVVTPMPTA